MERYFLAQIAYTVATQIAFYSLGSKSSVYSGIYSFFTLLIIVSMFGILDGKVHNFRKLTLAWMLGCIMALICYASLPKPIAYYRYIGLFEGLTLTTLGAILLFTAKTKTYLALAILWISLACFRLCYSLMIGNPAWKSLNNYLPALMCIVTFTFIGWRCRKVV